ncbi:MAG: hypothetical protein ACYC1C_16920 [Chloroflexota bacterium]
MAEQARGPEALVRRVLEIEERARRIIDEAREESRAIKEDAEQQIAELREQANRDIEQQVSGISAQAHAQGDGRSEQMLGSARHHAEVMEQEATPRLPQAIQMVVQQILGRTPSGEG